MQTATDPPRNTAVHCFQQTPLHWLALAGLACALQSSPLLAAPALKPPNIVLLVGDDWGFSDLGAYGSEIRTPNLDALARSGMKFSNFHTAATCSPTRAMLLTGVDNHRNGLGAMHDLMPDEHRGKPGYLGHLADNAVTLATMLKDQGYHTSIAGKWHLGGSPATLPNRRGFDRSFIQVNGSSDNWEQRPWVFTEKGEWYENGKEAKLPANYYSSSFIVDKALEYIDATSQDGKPFFAYVAFQAVHIPVQAPREFVNHYRGVYDGGWTALRTARRDRAAALGLVEPNTEMVTMASTPDWKTLPTAEKADHARRMEVYAGMAEAMDFHVGRLVEHLRQTGQYDNTVFVFLSDNGAEGDDPYTAAPLKWWIKAHWTDSTDRLGEKGAYAFVGPGWASASVAPLSSYKQWAGEGALRTPLIISGVPGMQGNQLSRSLVHVTDLVPTLLDLVGIAPHTGRYQGQEVEPLRGTSVLPVLLGQAESVHGADEPIGYELQGNAALFLGDYKIVRNLPPMGDGRWQLFNLATDPGEVHDLQAAMPELLATMLAHYEHYAKTSNVLPTPEGYDYRKQAMRYAISQVLLPQVVPALALVLAGACTFGLGWFVLRRRARRASVVE